MHVPKEKIEEDKKKAEEFITQIKEKNKEIETLRKANADKKQAKLDKLLEKEKKEKEDKKAKILEEIQKRDEAYKEARTKREEEKVLRKE